MPHFITVANGPIDVPTVKVFALTIRDTTLCVAGVPA